MAKELLNHFVWGIGAGLGFCLMFKLFVWLHIPPDDRSEDEAER